LLTMPKPKGKRGFQLSGGRWTEIGSGCAVGAGGGRLSIPSLTATNRTARASRWFRLTDHFD